MKLIVPRPVCWKRTRMAAFGFSVLFTLPVGAQTVLNPSLENRTLGDGLVGTANVVTDFSVSYTATGAEPQIGENLKVIIWVALGSGRD